MTNFLMMNWWTVMSLQPILIDPSKKEPFLRKEDLWIVVKIQVFYSTWSALEMHRILFVIKINFIKRQRTFNLRRCQHTWIIQIPNNPCLWSLCNICWLNQKGRTRSIEGNFYNSCQRAFWMESKKKDNYEWLEVCYIISLKFINIDLNCNS